MPGEVNDNNSVEQLEAISTGEVVRITLRTDENVTGKVLALGTEYLTLRGVSTWPHWERDYEVSEIEKIEIKENTGKPSTAGTVAIVLAGLGVVAAIIAGSQVNVN